MRSFNPFPIFETPDFRLRMMRKDDAPGVFKMRSDPEMMKFVPRPILKELSEAESHVKMILEKIENGTGKLGDRGQ